MNLKSTIQEFSTVCAQGVLCLFAAVLAICIPPAVLGVLAGALLVLTIACGRAFRASLVPLLLGLCVGAVAKHDPAAFETAVLWSQIIAPFFMLAAWGVIAVLAARMRRTARADLR